MRRATIKDVAKAAGVGMVTVSRALNGQPGVSESTRARIEEVAESLDYRPNRHARFLKLASARTIAVMMKGIDNPFFLQMMEIMEATARKHDYMLNVIRVPHDADEVVEAIRLVDEDAISGIVFLGGNFTHDPKIFANLHAPFVLSTIGSLIGFALEDYSSVAVDDFTEAQRVVNHLLDLGHQTIAFLGLDHGDTSVGRLRAQGYQVALIQAGLRVDRDLMRYSDWEGSNPYTFDYGYRVAHDLLTQRDDVTAIFAIADVLAVGAMKAATDLGLSVPTDLSIAGFDGIPLSRYVHPQLTTLVQPAAKIAELTMKILFDVMNGAPPRHELLSGQLSIGGSTAAPRSGALVLGGRA